MPLLKDESFAALVESVTECGLFVLDEQGRVLSWNRGAERTKGYSRLEAIGQPISRFYEPEEVAAGVPESVLRRAAEHGDDFTQGWRVREDGTRFWASVVTTALYDEHGRVRGYLKIVRDETKRLAEAQERATAVHWMHILTDACPVALLLLEGPHGTRMWANRRAAELLGESAGVSSIDPRHERLRYPDGREVPLDERPMHRALAGETRIESEEFLLQRPDGGTVPILGSAAPVLDGEGRVVGAVAAFDDISVLKQIEHRRKRWTALVAHELRQPLFAIVTSVGSLATLRDEEHLRRSTDVIARNARRLDRMIWDLLDVASIECGKLQVDVRTIDVVDHARAAADRAAAGAPDRHLLVLTHGDVPSSRADPDRLDQILDNLLSNALRYGEPKSEVKVEIDRVPDGVAVAVTNRGAGITREHLADLFQPFRREASAARVRESVGLGLYITKGLVEAQGGHIEATSTPGAETTFRFVLPAAA